MAYMELKGQYLVKPLKTNPTRMIFRRAAHAVMLVWMMMLYNVLDVEVKGI